MPREIYSVFGFVVLRPLPGLLFDLGLRYSHAEIDGKLDSVIQGDYVSSFIDLLLVDDNLAIGPRLIVGMGMAGSRSNKFFIGAVPFAIRYSYSW